MGKAHPSEMSVVFSAWVFRVSLFVCFGWFCLFVYSVDSAL